MNICHEGVLRQGFTEGAEKAASHLFVRLITLVSEIAVRSGACCEPMLPLRDMQGPSDWDALPDDGARPCLTAGLPREEAFGICSPAAAGAAKDEPSCRIIQMQAKQPSRYPRLRPGVRPMRAMRRPP